MAIQFLLFCLCSPPIRTSIQHVQFNKKSALSVHELQPFFFYSEVTRQSIDKQFHAQVWPVSTLFHDSLRTEKVWS